MLGITHEREGTLLRDQGRLRDAVAPTRRALRLRERIAARPDAGAEARRDVGVSHEALGRLYLDGGQLALGLGELQQAFEIYEALAKADPESVIAQETLAFGHLHLGRALRRWAAAPRPAATSTPPCSFWRRSRRATPTTPAARAW